MGRFIVEKLAILGLYYIHPAVKILNPLSHPKPKRPLEVRESRTSPAGRTGSGVALLFARSLLKRRDEHHLLTSC